MTARQSEVAALVVRGYTNEEIAGELGITERGVRAHVSHLLKRFGTRNRTSLTHALLSAGAIAVGMPEWQRRVLVQAQVAIPPDHEARLYDRAPFMVAVMSAPDFRIRYANGRFAKAVGWRKEELAGTSYADIFTDAPSDRIAARQRAARDGELKVVEGGVTRWKRADGTTGSGIFTYMMQPLWTTGGDIDALLFIGLARSGGPGARRPAGAARSANARLPRRSDRARRTTRAALEDRPAA